MVSFEILRTRNFCFSTRFLWTNEALRLYTQISKQNRRTPTKHLTVKKGARRRRQEERKVPLTRHILLLLFLSSQTLLARNLLTDNSTSFATSPSRLPLTVTPFSPDGLVLKIIASFPPFHDWILFFLSSHSAWYHCVPAYLYLLCVFTVSFLYPALHSVLNKPVYLALYIFLFILPFPFFKFVVWSPPPELSPLGVYLTCIFLHITFIFWEGVRLTI